MPTDKAAMLYNLSMFMHVETCYIPMFVCGSAAQAGNGQLVVRVDTSKLIMAQVY